MNYIEIKPNIPGLFRYVAVTYRSDAERARDFFFESWPQLTERHFEAVITGNYKVVANGQGVYFPEEVIV